MNSKYTFLQRFATMTLSPVFLVLCFHLINIVLSRNQPHIVLIVADDVGWNDVGFHGSNQIPTPNIDALAYNGVILNRFYTLPACTPSRAALLTGQYPIRLGLQGIPIVAGENRYIPHGVFTLPQKLKDLGYATHLVGKWHLGSAYRNVTPTSRGFDRHSGYWHGYIGYFNHYALGNGMTGLDMHEQFDPVWDTQGEYVTHLLTWKAEEVIQTHNESKPLFLMISHLAAHTGKDGSELEVPHGEENDRRFGYIENKNRRLYAGIMAELDKSVGRVVQALSKKGILDDTILMFFSDNGAQTEGVHENAGSNWPLRGLKFSLHDGGVRNIAMMYSSQLKNKETVHKEFFHITDLMPTLYAAAGGNVENLGKIDGINQWPTLTSEKRSKPREILLNIDERENSSAIIDENGYKLINGSAVYDTSYSNYFGEDGRDCSNPPYNTVKILQSAVNIVLSGNLTSEKILMLRKEADLGDCRKSHRNYPICSYNNFCLFDMNADPCETTNIANDFPETVIKLRDKLAKYWTQVKTQQTPFIDPKANPIYYNNAWYTWLEDQHIS